MLTKDRQMQRELLLWEKGAGSNLHGSYCNTTLPRCSGIGAKFNIKIILILGERKRWKIYR